MMELMDVILFELRKCLSKVSLLTATFLEYKSCINYPKHDEYFHWYFLIFLLKNLIVFAGIRRIQSMDNKYFSGLCFVCATLVYSLAIPSTTEIGYDFNTWSFAFIYLLLIYVVLASRVTWEQFFCVLSLTVFAFFAEEKMTGIQFAVDCFFAFFSLRFSAEKLFSKLTGLPYALFFLFTFYVENYCLDVWGLGMLWSGTLLSMIFVYLTRRHGNCFFNIFPIALCCVIFFIYLNHYGIHCLPQQRRYRPKQRTTPTPEQARKMDDAINRAMKRLTETYAEPLVKIDLPHPDVVLVL